MVPCDSPVCPGDQVVITSTTVASTDNYWKLPSGSCSGDSIQLPQGAGQGCGGMSMTCGPFQARNLGPDPSGKCLTSALTFSVRTTVSIQCGASAVTGILYDTIDVNMSTLGNVQYQLFFARACHMVR